MQNYKKPSRDEIYMEVAKAFAKRSTCLRKAVGACLIRDNHILGTGYNGAPRLQDECSSVGCLMVDNHCVRTVHAEVNAILSAAYNGVSTNGATLYCTAKPCFRCEGLLINAGIKKVIYIEDYSDGLNGKIDPNLLEIERYDDGKRASDSTCHERLPHKKYQQSSLFAN